jgi:hypothetical protein
VFMHVLCSFVHPDARIWAAGTIRVTVGRKEMDIQSMRQYLVDLLWCSLNLVLNHSFSSLSYDRLIAPSKVSSPQCEIQCFLFQFPVSALFLEVIPITKIEFILL